MNNIVTITNGDGHIIAYDLLNYPKHPKHNPKEYGYSKYPQRTCDMSQWPIHCLSNLKQYLS